MMAQKLRAGSRRLALSALLVAGLSQQASAAAAGRDESVELNSLSGTYLAARVADSQKDIASAARFYREAYARDPDSLFLLERSLVLTAADGEVKESLRYARDLAAKAPDSLAARLLLGVEDIRTARYSDAVEQLGHAGKGALADLTIALLTAWAQYGQGKVDEALATIDKVEGEDWYRPFKLLHAGYINVLAGRNDAAVEILKTAEEADRGAVRIAEAYARALSRAGRNKDAEALLSDFLDRFPDNAIARRALDEVRAGKKLAPGVSGPVEGAAEVLGGLGAAIGQDGGLELSALYLRLSLYLAPNSAGGLTALSLGNILDSGGQSEAAIEVLEAIDPKAPFRALGLLRAAMALDRLERADEAEAAFRESIARNPNDLQAHIAYGNMLRGREQFDKAAEQYSRAVALISEPSRGDWTLFYFRGIAYERTKQWPKAEADFKKALELFPDQPLVLNYLGYSWVDMGTNLDQALGMIRKAVELRPNDGYIVDSLGWAYYRLGRFDDAVSELERAVSLMPQDPVINDHLGDAYWQVGRTLEAQFQWRHARDLGAKEPELPIILKKIAEGRLVQKAAIEPAAQEASLSSPVSDATEMRSHVVVAGESLWTIAAKYLGSGSRFQLILDANKDVLPRASALRPGMRLRLPER
ncbi:tetratricopeptide repeat protein [Propylenella binzhouense]|uniref:Tetratricopeptide repeat protein n=1 Tax=Propylenella binzhouense TaxID=2555902 RepID=A0A964WVH2_9HYPH|nr:tetratricopeptide repeat protein [Propylenella binzhouense]MYZ49820.1 tetratricopeptide repeat protein [Propylenella binzhouense]